MDDLFKVDDKPIIPTITKDEYISKAKEFISKVNNIYYSNWEDRPLNDNEYPEDVQCEKCNNHCLIKINDYEHDCYADHESGCCFVRIFNEGNYSTEMGELLDKFNLINLIYPEF